MSDGSKHLDEGLTHEEPSIDELRAFYRQFYRHSSDKTLRGDYRRAIEEAKRLNNIDILGEEDEERTKDYNARTDVLLDYILERAGNAPFLDWVYGSDADTIRDSLGYGPKEEPEDLPDSDGSEVDQLRRLFEKINERLAKTEEVGIILEARVEQRDRGKIFATKSFICPALRRVTEIHDCSYETEAEYREVDIEMLETARSLARPNRVEHVDRGYVIRKPKVGKTLAKSL